MARIRTITVLVGLVWLVASQALGQAAAPAQGNEDSTALLKRLKADTSAGDAEAAFRLAELYRAGGSGVSHDIRLAVNYYRLAARLGNHPEAMNTLGILYEQGVGVAKSQATAFEWFEKAAWAGSAEARANLGKIHASGEIGVQDYRLATAELKKAAGDWISVRVPLDRLQITPGKSFLVRATSITREKEDAEPEYDWTAIRRVKWEGNAFRRPIFDPNYDSSEAADITVVDLHSVGDELKIDIGIFDAREPSTKPVHFVLLFDLDGRSNAVSSFRMSGAPALVPERLPNAEHAVQVVLGADRAGAVGVYLLSGAAPESLPKGRYFSGNNAGAQHDLGIIYTHGKENAAEVGGGINQNYQTAADWYFRAAEQGHARAQNNIGVLFYKKTQTRRDQRRLSKRDPDPKPIEQAAYWYRLASAKGHAEAQANLGFLYETGMLDTDLAGQPVRSLLNQSRDLYLKAADPGAVGREAEGGKRSAANVPGLAVAQHHLGSLYDPDESLARNLSAAREGELRRAKNAGKSEYWYRQAATKDHAPSQLRLAKRILARGELSPEARLDALKWLYLAADQPDLEDEEAVQALCNSEAKRAGVLAESARLEADLFIPSPENPADGLSAQREEMVQLARQTHFGNVDSIYQLGRGFQLGTEPLKKNFIRAHRLYMRAAQKGHAEAQFHLGSLYNSGVGVPYQDRRTFRGIRVQSPDPVEAAKWYKMAAEGGHAEAAYYLGNLYAGGSLALRRDFREAVVWFQKAAELGHAGAMNNLGYLYDEGLGVKKNQATAFGHYEKAAEAGHAGAQLNLAAFYAAGIGGADKDLNRALGWAEKAAAQAEPGAAEKVAAIRHLLRK